MTEKEWMTSAAPKAMLNHCWNGASARKKRLFGCACCYRVWHLLPDPRCKEAVRVAEQFADGISPPDALRTTHLAAQSIIGQFTRGESYTDKERFSGTAACSNVSSDDPDDSRWAYKDVADTLLDAGAKWHSELATTCALLRDIFGNPFRPVTIDPAWLTSDVVALARGIYEERAFDRIPILADALQDAGCDNADILSHCRDTNAAHVRGCWVLDLILGKT